MLRFGKQRMLREAEKEKLFFLMSRPLKGGGGVMAWLLRKITFFKARKKNSGQIFFATKLEARKGGLVAC